MRLECFYSVVCWRLLNTCNIQVSGIQFNCLLSLLLPGVKPWTHISHFAMEDNHWLLWGQDFTYVFPPWKANIKKRYLAEEFVCPDFMDALFYLYQMVCLYIGISDIAVSIQHFLHCLCVWSFWPAKDRYQGGKERYLPVIFMALKYSLAAPAHCLPSNYGHSYTTNCLWRGFSFILQVPRTSPMLYSTGLSILSHFIRYNIYRLKKLQFWIFSVSLRRNDLEHLTF